VTDEALTLRVTVIRGERGDDDYLVIWRGLTIGRIMLAKTSGPPWDKPLGGLCIAVSWARRDRKPAGLPATLPAGMPRAGPRRRRLCVGPLC